MLEDEAAALRAKVCVWMCQGVSVRGDDVALIMMTWQMLANETVATNLQKDLDDALAKLKVAKSSFLLLLLLLLLLLSSPSSRSCLVPPTFVSELHGGLARRPGAAALHVSALHCGG